MSNSISKKDRDKQNKNANIASLIILAAAIIIGGAYFIYNTLSDNKMLSLLGSIDTTSAVVLPSGVAHPKNDLLDRFLVNQMNSEELSKRDKREIIEYMEIQGVDTTQIVEAYNELYSAKKKVNKTDEVVADKVDKNSNGVDDKYELQNETPVIDFLKAEGLLTDEVDVVDRGESGITMLGGKSAVSYRNLYEAEKAFGTRLGLFFNSTSLTNYEMVNAYTVGNEFLQCVYAVNRDGSKIRADQDIEASEINTLTVKLSMTKETDELKKVYKDYDLLYTDTMTTKEPTVTDFYGESEDNIKMICMDMNNGRSYVIHTANGIDNVTARSLVTELINNLEYVDLIVYEEPTY